MIKEYVSVLAAIMGIPLSTVTVVEGRSVGCLDAYLLNLGIHDQQVTVLVHQHELDILQNGSCCDRLESKIRSALTNLQSVLSS